MLRGTAKTEELLTGSGHISKPEHQQISPRWLYAYEQAALLAEQALAKEPKSGHARNALSCAYALETRALLESNRKRALR